MISRNRIESKKGIRLSGNKCVICGWNKSDKGDNLLVLGAHVRPVKNEVEYDHYDNIIALCPNHHIEYDRGNLTINPEKKQVLHINKNDEFNGQAIVGNIEHILPGYFDYHYHHIYKG